MEAAFAFDFGRVVVRWLAEREWRGERSVVAQLEMEGKRNRVWKEPRGEGSEKERLSSANV